MSIDLVIKHSTNTLWIVKIDLSGIWSLPHSAYLLHLHKFLCFKWAIIDFNVVTGYHTKHNRLWRPLYRAFKCVYSKSNSPTCLNLLSPTNKILYPHTAWTRLPGPSTSLFTASLAQLSQLFNETGFPGHCPVALLFERYNRRLHLVWDMGRVTISSGMVI